MFFETHERNFAMRAVFESKELKIIGVHTDNMNSYKPMFHSHGEILFVQKGKMLVTVNGQKKELRENDMCIVFPYSIHSYEPLEKTSVSFVLFSVESVSEFREILLSKQPVNPYLEDELSFKVLLDKVVELLQDETGFSCKTAEAYLKALTGELLMKLTLVETNKADADSVKAVLKFCSENYCRDINVKMVCENTFVSERYITKIFKERVGVSFREYINRLRIARAVELLETSEIKITEVMYECGFKNQSTFNRVFLEETGITPREFQKRSHVESVK